MEHNKVPADVQQYLNQNSLSIGKWYCGGGLRAPIQLVGFRFHSYWGWVLIFSDKTTYRCSLPFWWKEVEEPKPLVAIPVIYSDNRKEPDKQYWQLKERHQLLCQKKLKMMDQGRNKLMRNAYINQELEMLRSKLAEYRTF